MDKSTNPETLLRENITLTIAQWDHLVYYNPNGHCLHPSHGNDNSSQRCREGLYANEYIALTVKRSKLGVVENHG